MHICPFLRAPDALRAYLTQARQETVARLVERVYDAQSGGRPSKWWMAFQVSSLSSRVIRLLTSPQYIADRDSSHRRAEQKRKFMGKSLAV